MNVRHPQSVLHSFSIKNIFYDETDFRLFYFHVTILSFCVTFMEGITHYEWWNNNDNWQLKKRKQ